MKSWAALVSSAQKRRGLTKSQAERRHARRRAQERYGLEFNGTMNKAIIAQIQSGKATFVEKQSHRVSVWDVQIEDGALARIVYDRERKQVVTFLPMPKRRGEHQGAFDAPVDFGAEDNCVEYIPCPEVEFIALGEESEENT